MNYLTKTLSLKMGKAIRAIKLHDNPVEKLTADEKFWICIAAGCEIETRFDSKANVFTFHTKEKCGIEKKTNGYRVLVEKP